MKIDQNTITGDGEMAIQQNNAPVVSVIMPAHCAAATVFNHIFGLGGHFRGGVHLLFVVQMHKKARDYRLF